MSTELHDFTRPTRLPADSRNRLTAWCQSALGLASKSWVKQLPAPLEASVKDLDVYYARQVTTGLTEATVGYRVKVGGVPALLLQPRLLLLNLAGVLLGDSAAAADRELTPIEERLAEYFLVHHWLAFFRETWPAAAPVPWVLDGRETNLETSRLFGKGDVLIVLGWQIRGPFGESGGAFCIHSQGLLDLLGYNKSGRESIPDAQVTARREAIVQQLPVNVEIVLGSVELKLSELSSLQVGDVVLLDRRSAEGVVARSGGQDLFQGQAGRVGSRKAIQIAASVKK